MEDQQPEPVGALIALGILLIATGVALGFWSFLFDVSVAAPLQDPERLFPARVANADKIALRTLIGMAAAANYVSGWVLIVGGKLLRR